MLNIVIFFDFPENIWVVFICSYAMIVSYSLIIIVIHTYKNERVSSQVLNKCISNS